MPPTFPRTSTDFSGVDGALYSFGSQQRVTVSKQDTQYDRLINERQVADLVGVSVATVRRWRVQNRGPRYLKIGALVRYCPRAVRYWLNAQPTGGDPDSARVWPQDSAGEETDKRSHELPLGYRL